MKAFKINNLMLVALVACLPIACGSTSPTGPVVDALDAEMTASALRAGPGLPPTAPQAPSTEADPVPQTGTPTEGVLPVPSPDPNSGSRPRPTPTPSALPDSRQPNAGAIPPPPVHTVPATPDADASPSGILPPPTPPTTEEPGARQQCLAAQAEIMIVRGSLPQPLHADDSVLLEMVMLGRDGIQITDRSCRGVAWSFFEGRVAVGAIITVGADARFATVTGTPGSYQIRAITSNGVMATVGITVQ